MRHRGRLWAIILAAGEGTRLTSLTQRLYGEPLPKQFAVLDGQRSLLQATVERFSGIVPPSRMVIVVPTAYERVARTQLAHWPSAHVVAQPANRGTGPGILLGLAPILALASDARVIVTPSDHYVPNPTPFVESAARSAHATHRLPATLIGVRPEHAETEYGWIEPDGSGVGQIRHVRRFVEKPSLEVAERLLEAGALWNTFVMTADARRLWDITAQRLVSQAQAIKACITSGGVRSLSRVRLARVYGTMTSSNFSQSVLQDLPGLGVVPVERSGWSDWGTAERVFSSLAGSSQLELLRARLADVDACRKAATVERRIPRTAAL